MTVINTLSRRKRLDTDKMGETKLARVLTTFDLTALGVGSTLGVGIYVLAGEVSKTTAGPAVVLSFLLAAIASLFAGLCYAEFGARIPRAGSVYVYSYYCLGEFVAFIMGWTLILEYVIGTASVARGLSTYIDSLTNNTMREAFLSVAPIHADGFLSPYVDFLALGLILLLSFALAFGVRESAIINNIFTVVNVGVVLFVIVAGAFKIDGSNWSKEPSEIPPEAGDGGFFPFGVMGALKGAAICFYGFVGFDCIATTGEEVKNPQSAIPVSILSSLFIVFLAYSGISSVLTLMWPYYLQDPDAPIPYVFMAIGWDAARWIVTVGGIFGLFASLFGAMFPLPRIVFAMSNDGLLFKFLGRVHTRFQTPWLGTLTVGFLTAILAAIFDLQQLVNLTSMGTLLAYTMIAVCVVILRYRSEDTSLSEDNSFTYGETTNLVTLKKRPNVSEVARQFVNINKVNVPDTITSSVVSIQILIFCVLSIGISLIFLFLGDSLSNGEPLGVALTAVFAGLMITVVIFISTQPRSAKIIPFKMPWVPVLPCISIFINIYLMISLDANTWIRFAIWMAIGILPYLVWYTWKYKHGDLGPNSRYEISRLNTILLNETLRKVQAQSRRTKKELKNGEYFNEGFVSEEKQQLPQIQIFVQSATPSVRSETRSLEEDDHGLQLIIDKENDKPKDNYLKEPVDEYSEDKIDSLVKESYGFLSNEAVEAADDVKMNPETGDNGRETLGKYKDIRNALNNLFAQQTSIGNKETNGYDNRVSKIDSVNSIPIINKPPPPVPVKEQNLAEEKTAPSLERDEINSVVSNNSKDRKNQIDSMYSNRNTRSGKDDEVDDEEVLTKSDIKKKLEEMFGRRVLTVVKQPVEVVKPPLEVVVDKKEKEEGGVRGSGNVREMVKNMERKISDREVVKNKPMEPKISDGELKNKKDGDDVVVKQKMMMSSVLQDLQRKRPEIT